MKVLFISETYPPVIRAAGKIIRDLALEFKEHGHEVYVLTLIEEEHWKSSGIKIYEEDGIKIIKVKVKKYKGINYVQRGFIEELLPYKIINKTKKMLKNIYFDLIITYSPPLNMYKVTKCFSSEKTLKFLFLRDIHPQTGVDLGIINNKLVYFFYRSKEKKLYKLSDHIFTQFPSNTQFILENNAFLSSEKVSTLYNFKKISNLKSNENINYLQKFNLEGNFIIIYGGNLSKAQDVEKLFQLAENLIEFSKIKIVIMGFGKEKERLLAIKDKKNIHNVVILDPLPIEEYESFLGQCHVGIIHLNENFKTQNFPGKTLDYMYAGLPMMAKINRGNDLGKIISEANCGYVTTGNLVDLRDKIINLYKNENLRVELGRNGRKFLEENLTAEKAYEEIMRVYNTRGIMV